MFKTSDDLQRSIQRNFVLATLIAVFSAVVLLFIYDRIKELKKH
mgnify:CR=1 FL=1